MDAALYEVLASQEHYNHLDSNTSLNHYLMYDRCSLNYKRTSVLSGKYLIIIYLFSIHY